jgi:hypothetical protein
MDELKLCGHCNPGSKDFQHSTGYCLGHVPLGGDNPDDSTVGCNQDPDCLTIYQEDDIIHICDWPAMRATIDAFQAARHPGKGE